MFHFVLFTIAYLHNSIEAEYQYMNSRVSSKRQFGSADYYQGAIVVFNFTDENVKVVLVRIGSSKIMEAMQMLPVNFFLCPVSSAACKLFNLPC